MALQVFHCGTLTGMVLLALTISLNLVVGLSLQSNNMPEHLTCVDVVLTEAGTHKKLCNQY